MSTVISQETLTDHESEPQGRSFGWYGMVFFLASEAVFFANLIAAYLYLRVRAGAWPPTAEHLTRPEPLMTGINTLVLLASSFPMHYAARAITKGNKRGLTIGLGGTALLGAIFLGGQAYEYIHNAFGPSTGVFGSTFYTLTGFHGAHVTFGVIFLLITFVRSMRGDFSKDKHFAVNAVEMYWHFVDAVWIILFLTVYIL
ncbi:MAG TPA: heme-copper oxidase subunit III [Ktedonobacterales bacterium]|jgi:heme/copper-type cytochrome/quinol oxidase subunit 3|nr:heme-copper oxidase subunit III [Ktedonobacterales bacterium]